MRHTQIKRRNRIFSVLLAACMLLTLLPGAASASPAPGASVTRSGTVGGGAPWRLYDDGTLVVDEGFIDTGEADMFAFLVSPWVGHRDLIRRIVFTGPITAGPSLGGLFRRLWNVRSIEGLGYFDTRNVQNMWGMFMETEHLTDLDLSGFDTRNVTDMSLMFAHARRLTSLDLSGFDTHNVTDMSFMFFNTPNLTSLNVSGFDTRNVTDMNRMFAATTDLTSLDLSSFDTRNVTNMHYMFAGTGLTSPDLSNFDTRNVTNMIGMFWGASDLTSLDLSSFDTRNVTNMFGMFSGATSLSELTLGGHFSFQPSLSPYPDHGISDREAAIPRVPQNAYFMGKWQNVGTGTADNPQGEHMFTSEELMKYYDGATMADTWVWQPGDGRRFTDVSSENWFFDTVMFAYENGIMQGTSATRFTPNGTLSRAMAATILHRLAGEPAVTFAPIFSDVAAGRWYADAVTWAYHNNIVQGIGGGRFAPNAPVTRVQFAAMLHRYAEFAENDVTVPADFSLEQFPDHDQVSAWATAYMRWANYRHLILGTGTGLLNPRGTASRAECATTLMRFMTADWSERN